MFNRRFAVLVLVASLTSAAISQAKVTDLLPSNSFGYVVIHRIGDVDKKLQALGQHMKLPIPSLLMLAKAQSGITAGLNESGSLAVAVLPSSEGPVSVAYLPVSDYAAFIEQLDPQDTDDEIVTGRLLGRPIIVGNKAGYAVIARPQQRSLLAKLLTTQPAANQAVAKTLEGDYDAMVVLSSTGVKLLTSLGRQGLQQVKAGISAQLGEDNPAIAGLEIYDRLFQAMDSEVDSVAVGVHVESGGPVRISKGVWVQPNGKLNSLLRNAKPHDRDLLSILPDVPYVVAFGGGLPKGAWGPLMDLSKSMMKSMPQLYGLNDKQIDQMIELSAEYFADLDSMSFLIGVSQDDDPLYSAMLGTMRVADAQTYLKKYREYWQKLDELAGDTEGALFKDVELEDITVDGVSMLKLKMPIPGLPGLQLPNRGEIEALMQKIYGSDGMTIYLAAADNKTILMGYTDPTGLRETLRGVDNKQTQLSNDRQIVHTKKLLSSGAHAVGYWNPAGTMEFVNHMIGLFGGPGIRLPAFPETPPVGWSLQAKPAAVQIDLVFPAETLGAVGGFVERVRQFSANPAGN